jgi:hypothetical protein
LDLKADAAMLTWYSLGSKEPVRKEGAAGLNSFDALDM